MTESPTPASGGSKLVAPLVIVVVLAVVGFLFIKKPDATIEAEQASTGLSVTAPSVENAIENAKDAGNAISEAATDATEAVSDAATTTGEAVSEGLETAGEKIDAATEATGEAVEGAIESAQDSMTPTEPAPATETTTEPLTTEGEGLMTAPEASTGTLTTTVEPVAPAEPAAASEPAPVETAVPPATHPAPLEEEKSTTTP